MENGVECMVEFHTHKPDLEFLDSFAEVLVAR